MKIITRYIATTIISITLIVVIALLGMDFFIQLVNEFSDLGKGDYGLWQAIQYVLLALPQDLYQLFPMAGLLGTLLGLGVLASHSELIVMRAATMSIGQISRAVILVILVLVAVVTALGEYVAPQALQYAENLKTMAKSGGQAVATGRGIWLREGNNFINIRKVRKDGVLELVWRYQFDENHQLVEASRALEAVYVDGQWQVSRVLHTFINEGNVTSKWTKSDTWDIKLNPNVLQVTQVDPEEMTLKDLYQIMQYKKSNSLEYTDFALPFWQRVFQPLATCVMMFLAIPFIFGPLRTVTMGLRLVAGIVVGFSFYLLNQFFGPFTTVYQFPPLLAAILPTALFGLIGYLLMLRVR